MVCQKIIDKSVAIYKSTDYNMNHTDWSYLIQVSTIKQRIK